MDLETIAQAIHTAYLRRHAAEAGPRSASAPLVPWRDLPAQYRDANREQARDILRKLRQIGAHIEPLDVPSQDDFGFTDAEVELLARQEHERWWSHKRSLGWTLGPRDEDRRTHPCLLPYDELSEAERQKDRDAVLQLPDLLRLAGYAIVRGSAGGDPGA